MKEKFLEYFNKFVEKIKGYIPDAGNAQDSMLIVIAYSCLIFLIVLAFMFAWVFSALKTGNFDMSIMLRFFEAVTAPSVVAAVTFLSVFFVDKNGDGRPDAAEVKAGEKSAFAGRLFAAGKKEKTT